MIKNIKWLFLVSLTFIACSKDCETATVANNSSDGQPLTKGSADFSKYVSVGNSLTAGYSDNALFIEGQKVSWSNILAQQFATVGGGEFRIPFMADNIGGFSSSPGVQIPSLGPRLYYTGNSASPLAAVTGPSTTLLTTSIAAAGPYNNVGVPGAKCIHLVVPGYATANPYFGRIATSPTQTVLNYATTQAPTFFSCWIGNNDVLGYATTGGDGSNPITPSAGTPGVGFDASYDAIINGLTAGGAKGVVATIPYVNTVPFFTTVPYNPIPLNAGQVAALMSMGGYGGYNAAIAGSVLSAAEKAARTINFVVGQNNAPVIVDEYLTTYGPLPKYRQATAADYLVLSAGGVPTSAQLAGGGGTSAPLADKWVLSKDEVAEIKLATDAYNAKIQAVATAKGLAFFDANAVMTQIATTGVVSNGFNVASTFITGGGFSTDGVHPSPRGYALLANRFIEAINNKYGSNIKGVNIGDYRILFPRVL